MTRSSRLESPDQTSRPLSRRKTLTLIALLFPLLAHNGKLVMQSESSQLRIELALDESDEDIRFIARAFDHDQPIGETTEATLHRAVLLAFKTVIEAGKLQLPDMPYDELLIVENQELIALMSRRPQDQFPRTVIGARRIAQANGSFRWWGLSSEFTTHPELTDQPGAALLLVVHHYLNPEV